MRKADAKIAVLAEWDRWVVNKTGINTKNGLMFYLHLEDNRPSILNFRSRDDPYEVVSGWLKESGRIA